MILLVEDSWSIVGGSKSVEDYGMINRGSKKLQEKSDPYITARRGLFPRSSLDLLFILLRSSRGAFGEDLGTGKYGSLYNSPRRGYSNVVHLVVLSLEV